MVGSCFPLGVNKYDIAPMHIQTASPMPMYLSHPGNDEDERTPFNLRSVYSKACLPHNRKFTYGSIAIANNWMYTELKLSGDLIEVNCTTNTT